MSNNNEVVVEFKCQDIGDGYDWLDGGDASSIKYLVMLWVLRHGVVPCILPSLST